MPVVRKTPGLYASGKYALRTPFIANPNANYTCMAIRSFNDILELKEDVFATYYDPQGISSSIYDADKLANVSIITLMSETASIIYVPDSYIDSYPDLGNVLYSRIVASVDLGALPDRLGLDFLTAQLAAISSDVIGVEPTVLIHKVPTTDFISAQDAAALEAARVAGITVLKTDYTRNRELLVQVTDQQAVIAALKDIIDAQHTILVDNGLA